MTEAEVKAHLEKFIYDMNTNNVFIRGGSGIFSWSAPCVGFSYDKSRNIELMDKIMEKIIRGRAQRANVICYLADWESVAEGIVFTTDAMFVKSPKNCEKEFIVKYEDIDFTYYDDDGDNIKLKIYTKYDITHYIDTDLFSKKNIMNFLDEAIEVYKEVNDDDELVW